MGVASTTVFTAMPDTPPECLLFPTEEFSHKTIVKNDAAGILDKEFSRKSGTKKLTVNSATVTDPYQPDESRFKITRKVLQVFLKHHNSLNS
ncbi:MAG: hypothetical protein QXG44_08900 [Candidatus Jordarchaeaceae archaeon]